MHKVERHADPTDTACDLQADFNEAGLNAVREAMRAESDPDFDGKHCIDCDVKIPELRLADGRIRCVDCQDTKERRSKLCGKR